MFAQDFGRTKWVDYWKAIVNENRLLLIFARLCPPYIYLPRPLSLLSLEDTYDIGVHVTVSVYVISKLPLELWFVEKPLYNIMDNIQYRISESIESMNKNVTTKLIIIRKSLFTSKM